MTNDLALRIAMAKEPRESLPALDEEQWSGVVSPLGAWYGISEYGEGDVPRWLPRPLNAELAFELLEEIGARVRWLEVIDTWGIAASANPLEEFHRKDLKEAIALAWLSVFEKGKAMTIDELEQRIADLEKQLAETRAEIERLKSSLKSGAPDLSQPDTRMAVESITTDNTAGEK